MVTCQYRVTVVTGEQVKATKIVSIKRLLKGEQLGDFKGVQNDSSSQDNQSVDIEERKFVCQQCTRAFKDVRI